MLFYTTRTPLCDDERRIVIGGALLGKKHDVVAYPCENGSSKKLRAMVWERSVQHSMRPKRGASGYVDGFVMPYQALRGVLETRDVDPREFVAFAPEDARAQFSYGSEQVTHGAAAATLVAARRALERIGQVLEGPWDRYTGWIDEQLSRLWKLQGPAPGLGVVLSALHKGFNGTLFAMALSEKLKPNADPWPMIDGIFSGKTKAPKGAATVTSLLRKRWERIKKKPRELDALKLFARIELTKDQAERALAFDQDEVLKNPYLLFENDRVNFKPISFGVVDRGLYPGREVALAHPLPESCNADLAEYDNAYRLRAACVEVLEQSTVEGHTLRPMGEIREAAKELSAVHEIPLDAEVVDICRDDFSPVVSVIRCR